MVDINLIGDDKTGEEERLDDFTQTTSMDTQELAFEERTETFDTTKTAGFAQKRSYSSLVSTLIIIAVIVLLGGSIYFFMFSGDDSTTGDTQMGNIQPPAQNTESSVTDDELARLEQEFADDLANTKEQQQDQPNQIETIPEPTFEEPPVQEQPAVTTRRPEPEPEVRSNVRDTFQPVSSDFLSNSKAAVQAVTNLISAVPSNLNTTLLSYTGQHVRVEFVAGTSTEAREFTSKLNQIFSSGNFSIVSESQVASNGGALEKVLVTGRVAARGSGANGSARFLNLGQAKDWVRRTAQQYSLDVRDLKTQQGSYEGGYQKVPLLVRVYGNQSALVGFLEEFSNQSVNFELAKILLVSPDMTTFSDDDMVLVLNMFLYEQA